MLDVNIDYGVVSGSFVRLDVRAESWQARGTVEGWIPLTPEEARGLAARLTDAADEVAGLAAANRCRYVLVAPGDRRCAARSGNEA